MDLTLTQSLTPGAGVAGEPLPFIAVAILLAVVGVAAVLIWVERRMLGIWQDRWGPNRVWFLGLGQVVADMIKIFTKDDWIPPFADKTAFVLAPAISMLTVLMAVAVVPFAPGIHVAANWNVGILFIMGMTALAVYGVLLGGWASNSKYALLGAIRGAAQSISYEVFMGLALMGVVIHAGSFALGDIVAAQQHGWFIIPQALGFVLFMIAGLAETHRLPLDLPEAEHELTAGFHTEYSGMKFGMFFVGEYAAVVLVSSLLTTLYFGGWLGPTFGLTLFGWSFMPLLWFVLKTGVFILFFVLLRAAIPRPRYDQLMRFGWLVMLPLALINIAYTGALVLWEAT
ncbi:NADH-quinone oxidoreductase subunit NuoH [Sinimarinibacterium sp. NLF-5-8]|uniref:NADH-quinone oxidoreductase subunit NuoH n=1 Tax=Sinimarinibacterium sp. NLF-5-8 TaxID=2698684 RepID=UPI00137C1507|nr:NADH-quinone oxidoreductase subunit NuoH [Sinimarinibacterium sp. NLF-5-8]QHS10227.1 NADH-quinone oxidoreductase subunit NuoH [Sinimarinibacterium sp. NLF-5-8]